MPLPMQNPRASNQLRDEADIQGKLPLSLDEIVVPVQLTGGDFPSHVWEGIGQGYSWGFCEVVADPGFRAAVVLFNPVGSGVVAHVSHVKSAIIGTAAFTNILLDMALTTTFPTTGGLAATHAQPADTRRYPGITDQERTQLRMIGITDQPSPLVDVPWQLYAGAAVDEASESVNELDLVLVPGVALIAVNRFVDREIRFGARWNERPARTAELARLQQG